MSTARPFRPPYGDAVPARTGDGQGLNGKTSATLRKPQPGPGDGERARILPAILDIRTRLRGRALELGEIRPGGFGVEIIHRLGLDGKHRNPIADDLHKTTVDEEGLPAAIGRRDTQLTETETADERRVPRQEAHLSIGGRHGHGLHRSFENQPFGCGNCAIKRHLISRLPP